MSIEQRLAVLEQRLEETQKRLTQAEDHLEIIRLLTSYGPAVDSCSAEEAAQLWVPDGVYDVGGRHRAVGRSAISALYRSAEHIGFTQRGSSHLTATPVVTLDGDKAQAVAYSFVILHHSGEQGFRIWRASANHWALERTECGWRITERYNRVLDGSEESHQLLRRGVAHNNG